MDQEVDSSGEISFRCKNCNQELVVSSQNAGIEDNCPTCGAAFVIETTKQQSIVASQQGKIGSTPRRALDIALKLANRTGGVALAASLGMRVSSHFTNALIETKPKKEFGLFTEIVGQFGAVLGCWGVVFVVTFLIASACYAYGYKSPDETFDVGQRVWNGRVVTVRSCVAFDGYVTKAESARLEGNHRDVLKFTAKAEREIMPKLDR